MKERRSIESWRIESVWPSPPKITSWWATRPGRRTEWIGWWTLPPAASISSCGALGGAGRRVELAVVVQLDDLALGHVRGDRLRRPPSAARRRSRSWGRRSSWPRERLGGRAGGVEVEAGGADDGVDAGLQAGADVGQGGVGDGEVDDDVGVRQHLGELDAERRIGAPGSAPGPRPPRPLRRRSRPFARRRRRPRPGSCRDQGLADRAPAAAEAVFVGADAGGGEAVGAVELGAPARSGRRPRSRRPWPASRRGFRSAGRTGSPARSGSSAPRSTPRRGRGGP